MMKAIYSVTQQHHWYRKEQGSCSSLQTRSSGYYRGSDKQAPKQSAMSEHSTKRGRSLTPSVLRLL